MSATQHLDAVGSTQAQEKCSPIIDLRQYTLYPGTRDEFIALFDRELVETQEACGMRAIGQFRDLGDPNRFVWMRGFTDMPSREKALNAFYVHGEAWKAHGEAARSKMIDSSDALLLRPAWPHSGFSLESADRRPSLESAVPRGIVLATIHHLADAVSADFLAFFEESVKPVLAGAGASFLGFFATEQSPNNFPRLPLREGENVFVSFAGFADLEAYHQFMTCLGRTARWRSEIYPSLVRRLPARPQILRLQPTSRSLLRA
jgi:hypothetical protein